MMHEALRRLNHPESFALDELKSFGAAERQILETGRASTTSGPDSGFPRML